STFLVHMGCSLPALPPMLGERPTVSSRRDFGFVDLYPSSTVLNDTDAIRGHGGIILHHAVSTRGSATSATGYRWNCEPVGADPRRLLGDEARLKARQAAAIEFQLFPRLL